MIRVTIPARPEIERKTGEPTGRMLPGFTGRRAGLDFSEGVATIQGVDANGDPKTLNDGQRFNFARWGFTVEEATDPDWQPSVAAPKASKKSPAKSKKANNGEGEE